MSLSRPEVDVTWSAVPAGRGRIEDSGRTLVITDVQPEDTGHYRCTGKNSVGSTAATIVLTVHGRSAKQSSRTTGKYYAYYSQVQLGTEVIQK